MLSGDRIIEITSDLRDISIELEESIAKCNDFYNEISTYTTKSKDNNNQIDNAYVDLKSIFNLLKQANNLIIGINSNLENYSKNGPKTF